MLLVDMYAGSKIHWKGACLVEDSSRYLSPASMNGRKGLLFQGVDSAPFWNHQAAVLGLSHYFGNSHVPSCGLYSGCDPGAAYCQSPLWGLYFSSDFGPAFSHSPE